MLRMRWPNLPLALLVLSLSAGVAAAQDARPTEKEDRVVMIADDDADMNAAMAHARETLDEFLAVAAKPPKGSSDFKLKVEIEDEHGTEHFWVTPFAVKGDGFEGTLANEPEIVSSVRFGQTIQFSRAQVSDWGYVRDGHQVGSFTVCVMLKRVAAEEAEYYRKNHGFDC